MIPSAEFSLVGKPVITISHASTTLLSGLLVKPFQLLPNTTFRITYVYGFNTPGDRKPLWDYLISNSDPIQSAPLGPSWRFQCCAASSSTGRGGDGLIQKKLDWVLGNSGFMQEWPASKAQFLPRSISDHSAAILHIDKPSPSRIPQFKFLNVWTTRDDYLPTIASSWHIPVEGNPMRLLITKLKRVKDVLKSFSYKSHKPHIDSGCKSQELLGPGSNSSRC
ncbi:hypothetical protein OIU85_022007 [Salix viminalis]|uniref:Endonuclease/exonuclease/phosphatase domain-containing protein n=1 Tax=Salix viminalis TaxID=40686 RepID=A0A9Q0NI38_SALVM|nr:hypothetical protein OIU85_022007 [Salix viminalis]